MVLLGFCGRVNGVRSVTAAIPAYNAERYLAEAIESVRSQTYPCAECLVIDDGSTDGTAEVAHSIDGVKYIYQPNGGDASARNRAISEASSEFIAFLDSDDVWLSNKVEAQIDLFDRRPGLGMVYSGVYEVDEALRTIDVQPAADGTVALRNTLIVEKPYMTGIGSTAVVPVDVALKVRFDERLRASSDWAFACRLAMSYPVEGIEEPLALYRQHGNPQVHKNLASIEEDMHLVWGEVFSDETLPAYLRKYRRRAAANLDLSLAASSHAVGAQRDFTRYLLRALARRPDRVVSAFWRRYLGP